MDKGSKHETSHIYPNGIDGFDRLAANFQVEDAWKYKQQATGHR